MKFHSQWQMILRNSKEILEQQINNSTSGIGKVSAKQKRKMNKSKHSKC